MEWALLGLELHNEKMQELIRKVEVERDMMIVI